MELTGKKVVVVGLGRTGMAVCRFLGARNAEVLVADKAGPEVTAPAMHHLIKEGVRVKEAAHGEETFLQADLIVVSPGVPETIGPLMAARQKGIPVIGELELSYRFIKEPIVAVTGTNGKTTTTALIGEMLKCSGVEAFVGGNIGNPLMEYVLSEKEAAVVVAEVSSFQLDTIETFRPHVGVLLNITEDHLDRYPDIQAYARSKMRLFMNQKENDLAVLNGKDPFTRSALSNITARKLFSVGRFNGEEGATIYKDRIEFYASMGKWALPLNRSLLYGAHNRENIAAAALASLGVGASLTGIEAAVASFRGLAHRLEFLRSVNGVRYYNDSKATNVDAVIRALEGFEDPVVLIMGGRDKGADFHKLEAHVKQRVIKLVVTGEAKGTIRAELGHAAEVEEANTLAEAVKRAHQKARPGQVVLFSPACTSFDQFTNYAQRGDVFKKAVEEL